MFIVERDTRLIFVVVVWRPVFLVSFKSKKLIARDAPIRET